MDARRRKLRQPATPTLQRTLQTRRSKEGLPGGSRLVDGCPRSAGGYRWLEATGEKTRPRLGWREVEGAASADTTPTRTVDVAARRRNFPLIDSVRAIAALSVLVFHVT